MVSISKGFETRALLALGDNPSSPTTKVIQAQADSHQPAVNQRHSGPHKQIKSCPRIICLEIFTQPRIENMSAQLEQWRVNTVDGVFETDLGTLRQWIADGSVAPTDKVSKGKLNWIEAGRAPMLKAAFHGETVTTAAPPSV